MKFFFIILLSLMITQSWGSEDAMFQKKEEEKLRKQHLHAVLRRAQYEFGFGFDDPLEALEIKTAKARAEYPDKVFKDLDEAYNDDLSRLKPRYEQVKRRRKEDFERLNPLATKARSVLNFFGFLCYLHD